MRTPSDRLPSEGGFTLVELLVVIVILGILIAIAVPTFLSHQNKADDASATTGLNTAYKNAVADATYHNSGNFLKASDEVASLSSDEPELRPVSTAQSVSDVTDPGTLYVIADGTPGGNGDFEAAELSKSGDLCTLVVTGHVLSTPTCTAVSSPPPPSTPTPDALAAMATTDSLIGGATSAPLSSSWTLSNYGDSGGDQTGTSYNFSPYYVGFGTTSSTKWSADYWNVQKFDGSGAGGDAVQFSIWGGASNGQTVTEWLNMPNAPTGAGSYSGYALSAVGTTTADQYTLKLSKYVNGSSSGVAWTGTATLPATKTGGTAGTLALTYKSGVLGVYVGAAGANFTQVGSWTDSQGSPLPSGYAGLQGYGTAWTVTNFKAGQLPA